MKEQWTLHEAREWMWGRCIEQYRADPANPVFHITFHKEVPPTVPPDSLLMRAFRLLEGEGLVTGHMVGADNTEAIAIRNLQLSDRAILGLEASASEGQREEKREIGFTTDGSEGT